MYPPDISILRNKGGGYLNFTPIFQFYRINVPGVFNPEISILQNKGTPPEFHSEISILRNKGGGT
jgi:hypothetical protein